MAKKTTFAWKPTRDLMKSVGGAIVQKEAVDFLNSWLVDKAKEVVAKALELTHHSKRQKLTREDLELVVKIKNF